MRPTITLFRKEIPTAILVGLLALSPMTPTPGRANATIPSAGSLVDAGANTQVRILGHAGSQLNLVAPAGDVNGDGIPDLIVGDWSAGRAYVIFGPWSPQTLDITNLGSRGFKIIAFSNGSGTLVNVAGVGDVNGDGLADVAVGSPAAFFPDPTSPSGFNYSGAVLIVYGKTNTDPISAELNSTTPIPPAAGYAIIGRSNGGLFGSSVAGIGDVNGDGIPDMAIGGIYMENGKGSALVIYGKHNSSSIFTRSLGIQGYELANVDDVRFLGESVAPAGDFNGDGHPDVIVGAGSSSTFRDGSAYILPGGSFTGQVGPILTIHGPVTPVVGVPANLGVAVQGIGDMNGDGLADVAILAESVSPFGREGAGSFYVVFGRAEVGTITLGTPGTAAIQIDGPTNNEMGFGSSIASGDFNGDGIADLVLGIPLVNGPGRPESGAVYVVYGSYAPQAEVDLANLGNQGYEVYGAHGGMPLGDGVPVGDWFGYTVVSTDLDGDGKPDIIAGAPRADHQCHDDAGEILILLSSDQVRLEPENPCAPIVSLNPTSLDFGDQPIGSSNNQNLTVAIGNSGGVPLFVSNIALAGANVSDFAIASNGCQNVSVPVGNSCAVSVTFNPTALGSRSATLSISDSASDSPQTVPLLGNGVVVTINGSTVTGANNITATLIDPSTIGEVPCGFAISDVLAYQLATTGTFTGSLTLAFVVPSTFTSDDFANLRILQPVDNQLIDVTPDSPPRNFATRTLYAVTNSFSPFYFAKRVDYCISPLFDQTKAYKIGSTVPIKLRLQNATCGNISSATTVLTARSLRMVGGTTSATVTDAGNANPDDNFRYDSSLGGYSFNLKTKDLSPGTWVMDLYVGTNHSFFSSIRFEVK